MFKGFAFLIAYFTNNFVGIGCLKDDELEIRGFKDEMKLVYERLGFVEDQLRKQNKETTHGCNCPEKRFVADGELDIESEVNHLRHDVNQLLQGKGSTYVRWGRTTCPNNSSLVYKGYTGGNWYTDHGGPANYLCLPEDPTWAKYIDGIQNVGNKIYGTEYQTSGSPFNPFPTNMYQEDAPCAVCKTEHAMNIMVPARKNCYNGWNLEYSGYLMTGSSAYTSAGEYICVDANPEDIIHGSGNKNGDLLYLVEAVCGSLPCHPYVDGRELACAVCSK